MNFPGRPLVPDFRTGDDRPRTPDAASLAPAPGHPLPFDPGAIEMARLLQRWRHERRRVFRDPIFSNPGWDILLDLFLAGAAGRPRSVKAACLAATVSKTTGLRYLRRLHELGLVTRAPHPTDHRSSQMALTDDGLRHMHAYLARLAR